MNTTRRTFLMTAPGTVAALALNGCEQRADGGWIDAHVHIWTPDTEKYPLAEGYSKEDMQPPSFTPEALFDICRPHGVERIVLIQMSFYKFDNSYMLDMMREYEGVFSGVAIIDENQPGIPGRMKSLKDQGVRGFRLYASAENTAKWQDSPGMHEMWRVGAEENLAMCCLADPEALPAIHRMCEAYPETPVVIDHFARIGMRGPVKQEQLDQLLRFADFEKTYVKTSAFYALGRKEPPYKDLGRMIQQLRDSFGAQRLMWASDCPFQVQGEHTYEASMSLIRDELDFLTHEDKQWMLRKTADRVFFT